MSLYKKQTINGFWKVDKTLARILGCHLSVIVLDELIFHEYKHADEDGWFFFQVDKLEEVCMLSRHTRRKCFERLMTIGILEVEKRGIPCRFFYRINGKKLDSLMKSGPTTEVKNDPPSEVKSDLTGEYKSDPTYIISNIKKKKEEVEEVDSEEDLTKSTTPTTATFLDFKEYIESVPYYKRLKALGAVQRVWDYYGCLSSFRSNYERLYDDYCIKKKFPGDCGELDEKWYHDCYEFIENSILREITNCLMKK